MSTSIVLHRHPLSGHAHRVELLLSMLGLPFESRNVDLAKRAHKSPEFLTKNAFGQIPVLEDGDLVLSDSNAILVYLATRYDPSRTFLPTEARACAEVQRWLSVAAGPLAQGPAAARLVRILGAPLDYDRAVAIARGLFDVLDAHLATRAFVASPHVTIADVALYAYTAHAPEGGISLADRPAIRAWASRIEALPGFVPMARTEARA